MKSHVAFWAQTRCMLKACVFRASFSPPSYCWLLLVARPGPRPCRPRNRRRQQLLVPHRRSGEKHTQTEKGKYCSTRGDAGETNVSLEHEPDSWAQITGHCEATSNAWSCERACARIIPINLVAAISRQILPTQLDWGLFLTLGPNLFLRTELEQWVGGGSTSVHTVRAKYVFKSAHICFWLCSRSICEGRGSSQDPGWEFHCFACLCWSVVLGCWSCVTHFGILFEELRRTRAVA